MKATQKAALSALLLAILTVFLSIEIIYTQMRLGPTASFQFHMGLTASTLSIWGVFYTAIATVTAWRKIGLSHVAGVITSIALAQALFNTTTLYKTEASIVSATLLVYAMVWLLRYFKPKAKPLWPLVGITWVCTMYQSIVYRILLPSYVVPGVLLFKTIFCATAAGVLWAALNREDNVDHDSSCS